MIALKFHKLCVTIGACLAASLLLSSCATPYRPLKHQYGYSDQQLGKDEYEVSFLGNGSSSYDRVLDLALLRAAEIALEHQAKHFTVVDVVHLSSARKYQSASQYFRTASPYLSTGGAVVPSAPEFTGGMAESYLMVTPPEERVFYRPGVRLRINLSGDATEVGYAYAPDSLRAELKRKYGLK
jgi:hypothetical protein